jgi:nitrite reductase/ring-hydroxylating ferredoxin subunit
MGEGTFWSHRVARIYCKMHGARYVAHTGVCDFGPCIGSMLERYAVRLDGEDAIVTVR